MKLHLSTTFLSILAVGASPCLANINMWQAEWLHYDRNSPTGYTEHYTVTGGSGLNCCDAISRGGIQAIAEAPAWITNDNYCGRKWTIDGYPFWLVHASDYPSACTPKAIQEKLPYGLIFNADNGGYIDWCQGMANDETASACAVVSSSVLRRFKVQCYSSWGTYGKKMKRVEGEGAPLPPPEFNITVPMTIPKEWIPKE